MDAGDSTAHNGQHRLKREDTYRDGPLEARAFTCFLRSLFSNVQDLAVTLISHSPIQYALPIITLQHGVPLHRHGTGSYVRPQRS